MFEFREKEGKGEGGGCMGDGNEVGMGWDVRDDQTGIFKFVEMWEVEVRERS